MQSGVGYLKLSCSLALSPPIRRARDSPRYKLEWVYYARDFRLIGEGTQVCVHCYRAYAVLPTFGEHACSRWPQDAFGGFGRARISDHADATGLLPDNCNFLESGSLQAFRFCQLCPLLKLPDFSLYSQEPDIV